MGQGSQPFDRGPTSISSTENSTTPTLDPILAGTIRIYFFRQTWDEVARVTASIHERIVSASLILHRLGSYARAFFRCAEEVNSPLSDGVILRKKG
jgi:Tn3 transposase DDE domain